MKAKITNTQNAYIVSYEGFQDSRETHFLKKNPMAFELARMEAEDYGRQADQAEALIEQLLAGRDSMLIDIKDIAEFSRFGGLVGAYFNGILQARRSLQAAGVEAVAA